MDDVMEIVSRVLGPRFVVTPTGCWEWTGTLNHNGYGLVSRRDPGTRLAHRIAYAAVHSMPPLGMHLDHLCRVRACVNPAHLEMVTPRVNILRGVGASVRNLAKTACANGHPFTGTNIRGDRMCHVCAAESARRARNRRAGRPEDARPGQGTRPKRC